MVAQQGSRRRQMRRMQQGMERGMQGKFQPVTFNKRRGDRNEKKKKGVFTKKKHSGYGITY